MRPLDNLAKPDAAKVRFVLSDIDDTITTEGRLTAQAYLALERLTLAGITVIPITGRPAGWCDHIARMWPVFGVVGENGAFYYRYDRQARKMHCHTWANALHLAESRRRLDALAGDILQAIPGCALASDQAYRLADLAIDFCEDVEPLPESDVRRIVGLFEAAGAHAKVSSIHVNGWFGDYDKLSMTRTLFAREFDLRLEDRLDEILFIGDSPNDAPMFGFFPLSVGVANVHAQLHRMATPPTFVTPSSGGAGFVEMAERLLAARKAPGPSHADCA